MEVRECIAGRRSIRSFLPEKVSREVLTQVVQEAICAPSWKNTQTARYMVIESDELKEYFAEECMMGYEGNKNIIRGCSALVVQLMVKGLSGYEKNGFFSTTKGPHWQSYDAGIAGQTFCLAAWDKGLGTVIMGIFDENKVKEKMKIPMGVDVAALIAVGYPETVPQARPRLDLEKVLFWES